MLNLKRGLLIFGLCIIALFLELIFYWAGLRSTYPPSAVQKAMMFLTVGTAVFGLAALIGGLAAHFTKKQRLGKIILTLLFGGYCFGALIFII